MIDRINLEQIITGISRPWTPVDVVWLNGQVIRVALLDGEYHWHRHTDEDELFFVYRGHIIIQLENQEDIELREGEMAVIPRGVRHCPKTVLPSYVLMFEPESLISSGD